MGKLIQAEFLKLFKSLGYRILLLCSAGTGILAGITIAIVAKTPDLAAELATETDTTGGLNGYSLFLQILSEPQVQFVFASIFAAIFIGNEFSQRTFDIGIISGCSRPRLFAAKAVVFLCGLPIILMMYPLVLAGITFPIIGFGPWNAEIGAHLVQTVLLSLLSFGTLGGFCIMIAMAVKNVGGIIGAEMGILLGISLLVQIFSLISFVRPVLRFLFLYQTAQVVQPESIPLFIAVCVGTLIVTLAAALRIFERAELK